MFICCKQLSESTTLRLSHVYSLKIYRVCHDYDRIIMTLNMHQITLSQISDIHNESRNSCLVAYESQNKFTAVTFSPA